MKKITLVLLFLLLLFSCSKKEVIDDKLIITATNFPCYDAARAVFGDKADIRMILPFGGESHSYEPTSDDIIRIMSSDLFIFTGGESETYVEKILSSLDDSVNTFALIDNVSILLIESEEGIIQSEEEEEEEVFDEHVWTSLSNEIEIISNLYEEAISLDPDNSSYYKANAEEYIERLSILRNSFQEIINNSERKTLVVTDRFPLACFAYEFGLDHIAAFPGCVAESEASAKTVASLIDYVKENNIPAVMHMELANTLLSEVVSQETGCKILEFNSCHNVSRREGLAGVTYISLMEKNLDVLREALN